MELPKFDVHIGPVGEKVDWRKHIDEDDKDDDEDVASSADLVAILGFDPDDEEKAWDESEHPREPGGSPEGGQFTSDGGGDEGPGGGTVKEGGRPQHRASCV